MPHIGQHVRIAVDQAQFAADRDFAALREGISRAGASLVELLARLTGRGEKGPPPVYRITYLYGDGYCDLATPDGRGERTVKNFPLRYLETLPVFPIVPQAEPIDDETAATDGA